MPTPTTAPLADAADQDVSQGVGTAMMAGAAVFAAASYLAGEPAGTAVYAVSNVAGLASMVVVMLGFTAFGRRYRAAVGKLGAWGLGLIRAGIVATILGYLVNLVGPLLPGDAASTVAIIGIPAWTLSHLMYIGATVLGLGCLRARGAVPRLLTIALLCGLPLMLAGVGLGLAIGGTAAAAITWFATEGQAGLAWFLVGLHLRGLAAARSR